MFIKFIHFLPERLTGENHLDFLEENLPQMIEQLPQNIQDNIIFQQDGAPAHYAHIVREYLTLVFGENWIGRGGPIPWPARSPDFTPCDFFLWGYLKSKVYRTRVNNVIELRQRIVAAAAAIPPDMIRKATHSVIRRARLCVEKEGGHFEQCL